MTLLFTAQLLLVLLPTAWLWLIRAPGRLWAAAGIAAGAVMMAGAALVGLWFYPPWWGLVVFAALYALAARRAWRRRAGASLPSNARRSLFAISVVLAASSGVYLTVHGIAGRLVPENEVLDLEPPLSGGRFCAISGGTSALLNFHYMTLQPGFESWRGESFGVDFVAVGPVGFRTIPEARLDPAPRSPAAYRIFGAEVRAPCGGRVLASRNDVVDQPAGMRNRDAMRGNFVELLCDGYEVTLAHLGEGSVAVRAGDRVTAGDVIGRVGNTGNTDEPHLHVSAQRPGTGGGLAGDPVHITFNGRLMARGACL